MGVSGSPGKQLVGCIGRHAVVRWGSRGSLLKVGERRRNSGSCFAPKNSEVSLVHSFICRGGCTLKIYDTVRKKWLYRMG